MKPPIPFAQALNSLLLHARSGHRWSHDDALAWLACASMPHRMIATRCPKRPCPVYDLAVIGGGINGCGIARDAAGRGASVILFEQNDLASATSSASTKLIHGGLRYLEHYEFRLVREALIEREVLWAIAPHIIWPLRFVLPHHAGLRPAWLLRLGLFLYDHLGGRKLLPATRTLDLAPRRGRQPAQGRGRATAFEYSDCWVEDARLVVLNAADAAERGAAIQHPHAGSSRPTATTGSGGSPARDERRRADHPRPGAGQCRRPLGRRGAGRRRPLQHARPRCGWCRAAISWCRKLYEHDRCYIFQNGDGRIIFAIPYERDFTLIGTTDRDYRGDPGARSRRRPRRSPISAPPPASISAQPVTPDQRRLDLFRRAPALRRRRQRGAGGDARLRADARCARRRRRRCSRSSAARSRPIAGWPKRRSRSWRRTPTWAARPRWTAAARCRAAISR